MYRTMHPGKLRGKKSSYLPSNLETNYAYLFHVVLEPCKITRWLRQQLFNLRLCECRREIDVRKPRNTSQGAWIVLATQFVFANDESVSGKRGIERKSIRGIDKRHVQASSFYDIIAGINKKKVLAELKTSHGMNR